MSRFCAALNPEDVCAACPDRGACCRYFTDLSVSVLLTDEEAAAFPEAVATPIGCFLPVKPGTGECIFLDPDGRCGVHHIRKPAVCTWWHCKDDFEEDGSPSRFLADHPHICTWLRRRPP
jgi:hypothetical protein